MVIRIFLLQHPHIEIDGREAFLKLNKKSLAMICYLAARQGQTVSRELLSEIFWPEQQEENARSNLRQSLSYIKKICTEELSAFCTEEVSLISSERNSCGLNSNLPIQVDLVTFREKLKEGCRTADPEQKILCLQAAADACRGDILEGLSVRGSVEFEEWLLFERESVHQDLTAACKDLSSLYKNAGRIEQAIACLKKLLQIDPLLEEVHLELMKLYYENMERTKAICQYKECARILGEELNISPMEETRNFYHRIAEEGAGLITPSATEKQSLKLSLEPAELDYEGIYQFLTPLICEEERIPEYLKAGLAILFPQFSDRLTGQNLPEIYLYHTIRMLLEEFGDRGRLLIEVKDAVHLDRKTAQLAAFLQRNLDHPNIDINFLKEDEVNV